MLILNGIPKTASTDTADVMKEIFERLGGELTSVNHWPHYDIFTMLDQFYEGLNKRTSIVTGHLPLGALERICSAHYIPWCTVVLVRNPIKRLVSNLGYFLERRAIQLNNQKRLYYVSQPHLNLEVSLGNVNCNWLTSFYSGNADVCGLSIDRQMNEIARSFVSVSGDLHGLMHEYTSKYAALLIPMETSSRVNFIDAVIRYSAPYARITIPEIELYLSTKKKSNVTAQEFKNIAEALVMQYDYSIIEDIATDYLSRLGPHSSLDRRLLEALYEEFNGVGYSNFADLDLFIDKQLQSHWENGKIAIYRFEDFFRSRVQYLYQ